MAKYLLSGLPLLLGACAGQVGTPAPGAVVELDAAQANAIHAAFAQAASPTGATPLQFVPASGVRWADVPMAVQSLEVPRSGHSGEFLVAVLSSEITDSQARFRMETAEHWPVVITATRDGDRIAFAAVVGPYPANPDAVQQARELEQAAHVSLLAWGRKRALPISSP
jgi:hypothetical protein